jgi:hypothetical protein
MQHCVLARDTAAFESIAVLTSSNSAQELKARMSLEQSPFCDAPA